MTTHNPKNERIKRQYFTYLREANKADETTVDAVAASIARFETYIRHRDFKSFHQAQAIAFKRHLAEDVSKATGDKLSKATLYAMLMHLKRFFVWLAGQPGYKSSLCYSDADYFNLPRKEDRIATARRERPAPTLEQVRHVIAAMPATSDIEKRNRALVAFTLLTGARDSAIASFKLVHVDLAAGCVHQDARVVKTKGSKSFTTYFFPVGADVEKIVADWVNLLRTDRLWGNDDPLFPRTKVSIDENRGFMVDGLDRAHWSNASPIRQIFKQAFEQAGLPYFNPHSFRSTLATLGEARCPNPEAFKAWSQNLGHEKVLTTLLSYGTVATPRQGEIIRAMHETNRLDQGAIATLQKLVRQIQDPEILDAISKIGGR